MNLRLYLIASFSSTAEQMAEFPLCCSQITKCTFKAHCLQAEGEQTLPDNYLHTDNILLWPLDGSKRQLCRLQVTMCLVFLFVGDVAADCQWKCHHLRGRAGKQEHHANKIMQCV